MRLNLLIDCIVDMSHLSSIKLELVHQMNNLWNLQVFICWIMLFICILLILPKFAINSTTLLKNCLLCSWFFLMNSWWLWAIVTFPHQSTEIAWIQMSLLQSQVLTKPFAFLLQLPLLFVEGLVFQVQSINNTPYYLIIFICHFLAEVCLSQLDIINRYI